MKKSRIIIPALGLIALGTAASITGTVAWFSMNTSVTATGMQVSVKSNSIYLLISGTNTTASTIQTENQTTTALTVSNDDSQLYPAAHESITNTATATATDVDHGYYLTATPTTEKTAEQYAELDTETKGLYTAYGTATNWYYKIADAPGASTSNKAKHYLASVDPDYVIHKTCYLTLAAGSNAAADLKVTGSVWGSNSTATGAPATYEPVKALITSSNAAVELDKDTTSSNTVLAGSITDSTVVQLDIFLYYDGANSNVFTNNKAKLDGATISLEFGVTAA